MYIDPNSGGMLFQILAVSITVITGFFLIFAGNIRAAVARMRRKLRKEDDKPEDTSAE